MSTTFEFPVNSSCVLQQKHLFACFGSQKINEIILKYKIDHIDGDVTESLQRNQSNRGNNIRSYNKSINKFGPVIASSVVVKRYC